LYNCQTPSEAARFKRMEEVMKERSDEVKKEMRRGRSGLELREVASGMGTASLGFGKDAHFEVAENIHQHSG
jgi:hypothetical protein